MPRDRKVVQTTLTRDEYELLMGALAKKGMNIQEGLKKAVLAMVDSNYKIDREDPFFKIRSASSGGIHDLSEKHDRYLYQSGKGPRSRKRSY